MRQILIILAIIISPLFVMQSALAQTHVTTAAFTAKVNLLDSYIAAGDTLHARITWSDVHTMMLSVLAVSKQSIYGATSPADKASHVSILDNQQNIYFTVWGLKNNLVANRTPLHTKLSDFGATIY
jgi:hypothetical protein